MPSLIIAFLGNPGEQYAATRHNAGRLVGDAYADRYGLAWKVRGRAEVALHREAVLLRPLTYMNDSGSAIRPVADFYRLGADRLIVVHDETEIPFGRLHLRSGGGNAGHNGLRSVSTHFKSSGFHRLRVGIGRPVRGPLDSHVLGRFSPDETAMLGAVTDAAVVLLEPLAAGTAPEEKRVQAF